MATQTQLQKIKRQQEWLKEIQPHQPDPYAFLSQENRNARAEIGRQQAEIKKQEYAEKQRQARLQLESEQKKPAGETEKKAEITLPSGDPSNVKNQTVRNHRLTGFQHYPTKSVPSDWYHPFNVSYKQSTDLIRRRRMNLSVRNYIQDRCGEVEPIYLLTEQYAIEIANGLDPAAASVNARNITQSEIMELISDVVIKDLAKQIFSINNDTGAERVANIAIQNYFNRLYEQFAAEIPTAETDIKIRQAKQAQNIMEPGTFSPEECAIPELNEIEATQEDREAYRSVAFPQGRELIENNTP